MFNAQIIDPNIAYADQFLQPPYSSFTLMVANGNMTLSHTLCHHVLGVNAVAISPEGDRLLSGGKPKFLTSNDIN